MGVCKEHDQAVDADPQASCRRHSLADRFDELLVQGSGLFIASIALLLPVRQGALFEDRIVELCVGVADLAAEDEGLKALDKSRFAQLWDAVGLAERRRFDGVVDDVVGLDQMLFGELFKESGDQQSAWSVLNFFRINEPLSNRIVRICSSLSASTSMIRHRSDALLHRNPFPRCFRSIVVRVSFLPDAKRDFVVPKIEGDLFEELFCKDHHVVVVPVGGIGLEHGEFRVMRAVDPFIAEDRPISKTLHMPPTISFLRGISREIRRNISCSRALSLVTKGWASAPP